jgi:chromosome partitioning protein
MITLAFANQKGGVGKTASAAAIGAGLHRAGKRVLYIDLDPQANLSAQLGADNSAATITDVFTGNAKIKNAIQDTTTGALIAADEDLAQKGILTGRGAEYRLKSFLEPVKRNYDVCIIDCPPQLGILTVSALTAADGVIIPCKADRFSLDALRAISETIATIQDNTNADLKVYGVLVTMYTRTTVNAVMLEELQALADKLGINVYTPQIRRAIAVDETQLGGSVYDTRNNARADYQKIVNTILEQMR